RIRAEANHLPVYAGLVVRAGEPAARHLPPVALDDHRLAPDVVAAGGAAAPAPLEAGVDDRLAGAADGLAGSREDVARLDVEVVGRGRVGGDDDLADDRALAGLVARDGPAAGELRRLHRRRPRRPARRVQRIGFRQVLERALHRMAVVRRPSILARLGLLRPRAAEALTAVHRLVVDERVVAAVHVDEQAPVFLGAALAEHARHRVARRAGVGGQLVGGVRVLDHAALHLEEDRAYFFGGEAVVVGEVFEDVARVGRLEPDVVERDHPLDGLLPVLRAGAPVRDAGHAALVVGAVAAAALRFHQIVLDR